MCAKQTGDSLIMSAVGFAQSYALRFGFAAGCEAVAVPRVTLPELFWGYARGRVFPGIGAKTEGHSP